MVTACLSPYTCKHCTVFKQFDGLKFDGLAGKQQKRQNFPHQNFGHMVKLKSRLLLPHIIIHSAITNIIIIMWQFDSDV